VLPNSAQSSTTQFTGNLVRLSTDERKNLYSIHIQLQAVQYGSVRPGGSLDALRNDSLSVIAARHNQKLAALSSLPRHECNGRGLGDLLDRCRGARAAKKGNAGEPSADKQNAFPQSDRPPPTHRTLHGPIALRLRMSRQSHTI